MTRNSAVRAGFTLIELMAVVLILAILAGVALPKFFNYQTQAKKAATKGTLGGVRAGIANFYADQAINSIAARYPLLVELTNGETMQENIPENPYNDKSGVRAASKPDASLRSVVGVADGWGYYFDNTAGSETATFYANDATDGANTF